MIAYAEAVWNFSSMTPETQAKINVLSFGTIQNDATLNDVVAQLSDELQQLTSQLLRQQETNEYQQYIIAQQAEQIDVLTKSFARLEADTATKASQENGIIFFCEIISQISIVCEVCVKFSYALPGCYLYSL